MPAASPVHGPTGDSEHRDAQGEAMDRDDLAALRAIVEGTAQSIGDAFFRSLVSHLSSAMGVGYAFVAVFDRATMRARTLAYWGQGTIRDNIEFDLAGTPCEDVIRSGLCHHPRGVREKFQEDRVRPVDRIRSTGGSAPMMERHSVPSGRLYRGKSPAAFGDAGRPGRPRRQHPS
jgi:hypothetical protein